MPGRTNREWEEPELGKEEWTGGDRSVKWEKSNVAAAIRLKLVYDPILCSSSQK